MSCLKTCIAAVFIVTLFAADSVRAQTEVDLELAPAGGLDWSIVAVTGELGEVVRSVLSEEDPVDAHQRLGELVTFELG